MVKCVHLTNVYSVYLLQFKNWDTPWRCDENQLEQNISLIDFMVMAETQ